ncbi:MAG TPA: hypothetical protein VJT31_03045, partial [Rugosimonospora sp.]|nr:hypothetical protein [Rugosimonospora sp.]
CPAAAPVPARVTTAAGLSALFTRYAATTRDGWTGGDSTFSVRLPDGRTLWLFSDTFLGPLNRNGTRPTGAEMVNNTFVVQDGDQLTTVYGGTPAHPTAIMPPPGPDRWFWTGDGMLTGDGLVQVVFREYQRTGTGALSYGYQRSVVATFSPDHLNTPSSVDPLPSDSGVAWGAALLPASRSGDGYTYLYGVVNTGTGKAMRVARIYGSDLRHGTWQYRAACGWSTDERAATDVMTGVADEYSITPWQGRYLLVTVNGTGWGSSIEMLSAPTPAGPFTGRTVLYRMPEPGPGGSYRDRYVIAYNAHGQLTTNDTILISYNVNSLDGSVSPAGDVYRDASIYRPRFIQVHLRSH